MLLAVRHDMVIFGIIQWGSVAYAIGCTSFLSEQSPNGYYVSAYISLLVMFLLLIIRLFMILKKNNTNQQKERIINQFLVPLYYLTGLFELNMKYGYGNTEGISGEKQIIGTLNTIGISHELCVILNLFVFIVSWIILLSKAKEVNKKSHDNTLVVLLIIGVIIFIKCVVKIINHKDPYADIIIAHILYWIVFISKKLIRKRRAYKNNDCKIDL